MSESELGSTAYAVLALLREHGAAKLMRRGLMREAARKRHQSPGGTMGAHQADLVLRCSEQQLEVWTRQALAIYEAERAKGEAR